MTARTRLFRSAGPIKDVIAEGSAGGAVVAADGAMAASVDQREAETVEGIAEGIDGDGALRLRVAAGRVRRITAGDVFFGGA